MRKSSKSPSENTSVPRFSAAEIAEFQKELALMHSTQRASDARASQPLENPLSKRNSQLHSSSKKKPPPKSFQPPRRPSRSAHVSPTAKTSRQFRNSYNEEVSLLRESSRHSQPAQYAAARKQAPENLSSRGVRYSKAQSLQRSIESLPSRHISPSRKQSLPSRSSQQSRMSQRSHHTDERSARRGSTYSANHGSNQHSSRRRY